VSEGVGIVLRTTGSWYDVEMQDGTTVACRPAGRLRLEGFRSTNPVAVGDKVDVQVVEEGTGMLTNIHPRKNCIVRKSVNLSHESHVVAANLDRAFLVVTLSSPRTSTGFMDRFLVTAEAYGIPTTLVLNKLDALDDDERESAAGLSQVYRDAGYGWLEVSARTGVGLDELRSELAAGIHVLSGHSGVGKSTLINRLIPGLELKTAEVSDSHNKGRHTTTFAEMHPLPDGGYLVDTPGIKGFGLVTLEKETLNHHFPEFFRRLPECKFHNCLHHKEPGCAVRGAVEGGEVAPSRYRNYLEMLGEFDGGPYRDALYR
jgi:ribosome biogenesis GTPase / thiamine phosphate phosphatase